jgi:hypothetical protein
MASNLCLQITTKNPPPQKQHFLMLLQQKLVHKFKKPRVPSQQKCMHKNYYRRFTHFIKIYETNIHNKHTVQCRCGTMKTRASLKLHGTL